MNVRTWLARALSLGLVGVACAPSDPDASEHEDEPTPAAGDDASGSGAGFAAPAPAEPCNGLDDDQDGLVDEGCACAEGATQVCFLGTSAAQVGVGVCVGGSQTCEVTTGGEFGDTAWGPCTGSLGPGAETCGDGVDSDCDGADPACGGGGGDGSGGGGTGVGGAGVGGGGGCVPGPEICGNGVDEDCNGVDDACDVIDVSIFLLGDCITASCPASHPYPVGCEVLFSPGDDRGCVASTPSSSVVYFQAGDQCENGLVGGTLSCSTSVGAPLDASSCPINKPIPIYATDPSGCPDLQ